MAKNNITTNLGWNKLQPYFQCFLLCSTILAGYSTGQKNSSLAEWCALGKTFCNQECSNIGEGFQCYCRSGYELQDRFTCKDIDECLTNNGNCSHVCHNTEGSYTCDCNIGYELMSDQHRCQDKNECSANNGGCDHGCSNTVGSYECNCNTGYLPYNDRKKCVEVNECSSTSLHTCDKELGTCTNTDGSYECGCKDGYQLINPALKTPSPGQNSACEDVDECADDLRDATCGENQDCTNTNGSFICRCSEGFYQEQNGTTCMDIENLKLKVMWLITLCSALGFLVIVLLGVTMLRILCSNRSSQQNPERHQTRKKSSRVNSENYVTPADNPNEDPSNKTMYEKITAIDEPQYNNTVLHQYVAGHYLTVLSDENQDAKFQYEEIHASNSVQYEELNVNDRNKEAQDGSIPMAQCYTVLIK